MHTTQAVHKMNIVHANHKDATSRPGGVSLRGPAARPADHSHTLTTSSGIEELMGKSGSEGVMPASTRLTPSMATMAPLSVHNAIFGMRTITPCASPTSSSFARSWELAEKPPPTIRVREPYCSHPAMAFLASTVATESASEAQMSSTGMSRPAARCSSIHRATAVLTPEKLKSYGCCLPALPWVSPWGTRMAWGSPS